MAKSTLWFAKRSVWCAFDYLLRGGLMNGRVLSFVTVLAAGGFFVAHGAFSQSAAPATRRAINLPDDNAQLPFSGAILAGNTLYLSGRIGIDSKTGKAPAEIDDEIKLLLDRVKATLTASGMAMDDLVYVQVACTDLARTQKTLCRMDFCRRIAT